MLFGLRVPSLRPRPSQWMRVCRNRPQAIVAVDGKARGLHWSIRKYQEKEGDT